MTTNHTPLIRPALLNLAGKLVLALLGVANVCAIGFALLLH